jgi:transposase
MYEELLPLGYAGSIGTIGGFLATLQKRHHGIPPEILPIDRKSHVWMYRLIQGELTLEELNTALPLDEDTLQTLYHWILTKRLKYRNRAVAILAYFNNISQRAIARFLGISHPPVRAYIERFQSEGIQGLFDRNRVEVKKYERQEYKDAVFRVLHTPPSVYNINRTTWRREDLHRILKQEGFSICKASISQITKDAGYKFLKAKTVLTSNDPQYREKLQKITGILANLQPDEKFFSIDEFGPFAVKMRGGRSLSLPEERKVIPQYQKSKGSLIVTAALELSTNQVTHFYSPAKNTTEMIKLLEKLLQEYSTEECIYFSWDAASWHASKALYEIVDEVNTEEYRTLHHNPRVELAPLPYSAQFLNVIESVFSGMARAIIHNSDYASVDEAMAAIDRHFAERNQAFKERPKRAGNKIWGKERTKAEFNEGNNCKDPHYCR